jgi:hypothetical protein
MPKKTKKVETVVDLSEIIKIDEEKASEVFEKINIEVVSKDGPVFGETMGPKLDALIAYAPFEVNGERYEAGDVFTPPAGWTRDDSFEEFREVSRKNKGAQEIGIAFTYAGEIIDPKTKERQSRRAVLPIKEA